MLPRVAETPPVEVVGDEDVVVAIRIRAKGPAWTHAVVQGVGQEHIGGWHVRAQPIARVLPVEDEYRAIERCASGQCVLDECDQAVELAIARVVVERVQAPRDRGGRLSDGGEVMDAGSEVERGVRPVPDLLVLFRLKPLQRLVVHAPNLQGFVGYRPWTGQAWPPSAELWGRRRRPRPGLGTVIVVRRTGLTTAGS